MAHVTRRVAQGAAVGQKLQPLYHGVKNADAFYPCRSGLQSVEPIFACHLRRLLQPEEEQEGRRDVCKDAIIDPEILRLLCHVNEMHKICRMRGVRRSVRIAHQLAISVISQKDELATE